MHNQSMVREPLDMSLSFRTAISIVLMAVAAFSFYFRKSGLYVLLRKVHGIFVSIMVVIMATFPTRLSVEMWIFSALRDLLDLGQRAFNTTYPEDGILTFGLLDPGPSLA